MAAKKTTSATAKPAAEAPAVEVEEDTNAAVTAAEELEAEMTDDELLADMPELRAPYKLRLRHRNRIMRIALKFADNREVVEAEAGRREEDADNRSPETIELMLNLSEEIDDFAESIAVDPVAYVEWAERAEIQHMIAIMNRYSEATGESNGS